MWYVRINKPAHRVNLTESIDHYNYQLWLDGSVSISVWWLGFKFFSLYFSDEPSARILISSVFEDPQTITSTKAYGENEIYYIHYTLDSNAIMSNVCTLWCIWYFVKYKSFRNLQNKLHVGLATMCRCSHSHDFGRGDAKNLVLQQSWGISKWYVFRFCRYSLHVPERIMTNYYATKNGQRTLKKYGAAPINKIFIFFI